MSKSPIFFVYIDLLLFFRNFSNFKEKLLRVELLSIFSSWRSASGYPRSIPPDLTLLTKRRVQFSGLPWELDHIMLCRWIWVAATMMLETMSSTSFPWHSLSPCCLGVWSSMKESSWLQDRCSTLNKPSNGELITFSRRSRGRPKSGYRSEHSKLARDHFHCSIHRSLHHHHSCLQAKYRFPTTSCLWAHSSWERLIAKRRFSNCYDQIRCSSMKIIIDARKNMVQASRNLAVARLPCSWVLIRHTQSATDGFDEYFLESL